MFIIQKITQHYELYEDRICFTVQNAQQQVMQIWITQRFANNVVRALTQILENNVKTSQVGQAMATTGQPLADVHLWEQLAAQKQLKPDIPVKPEQAQYKILAGELNVSFTQREQTFYTLIFKEKNQDAASLQLDAVQMRQWLGIFHQMYGIAKWPMQVWPVWFNPKTNQTKETANVPRVLH